MATRQFALNEDPHVATVGKVDLYFKPEVAGAEFAQAYDSLRQIQQKVSKAQGGKASSTKHAKAAEDVDTETLVELSEAMRSFLSKLMHDDQSRSEFAKMIVPDRVLYELIEWVAEVYGGGSGNPEEAGGTSTS